VTAYIVKVPLTAANEVLRTLRSVVGTSEVDLQHLRRVTKALHLPDHVRNRLSQVDGNDSGASSDAEEIYVLIGPVSSSQLLGVKAALAEVLKRQSIGEDWIIPTDSVPLLAPTSYEQAKAWSQSHWPTIYKKSNPFGPHPSIVAHAESEIAQDAGRWMSLASQAAAATSSSGVGVPVGAVIVDRQGGTAHAVALAGDGRWKGGHREGPGNVMAHAAMRAIGMVARKLKRAKLDETPGPTDVLGIDVDEGIYLDYAVGPEELEVFINGPASADGYLCHGLEIYLTHEPCVMCSMALLHSRFGRVIFARRMAQTGALCSEADGLGHGLFWRKELNWCLLAWQLEDAERDILVDLDATVEA
jgi:tRNA-specific adenosine deaminase 3